MIMVLAAQSTLAQYCATMYTAEYVKSYVIDLKSGVTGEMDYDPTMDSDVVPFFGGMFSSEPTTLCFTFTKDYSYVQLLDGRGSDDDAPRFAYKTKVSRISPSTITRDLFNRGKTKVITSRRNVFFAIDEQGYIAYCNGFKDDPESQIVKIYKIVKEENLSYSQEEPKQKQAEDAGRVVSQGYVDLGLPSGTLWEATNEDGLYDYDSAVKKFGSKLPTKEQLVELKEKCSWFWTGSEYKVTGPNGNSIILPAAGYRNCSGTVASVGSYGDYWSSTSNGSEEAWYLYFNFGGVGMFSHTHCFGRSVRLVQNNYKREEPKQKQAEDAGRVVSQGYVDLGLPSGTLWGTTNEDGLYDYDSAVKKFGSKLPMKEQLVELKEKCRWSRTDRGYKVMGPNGNSIILPLAGYRDCNGSVYGVGSSGNYWSSTLYDDPERTWYLNSSSISVRISGTRRCTSLSVRLVHNNYKREEPKQKQAEDAGRVVSQGYVDLGLPSGTLWGTTNEDGLYDYDSAVREFGSKLPTKEQFKELIDKCRWSWTGSGYKVTGPNGNSINLPAAGYRGCRGEVNKVGFRGYYWSSTPSTSGEAYYFFFLSDKECTGSRVRCVGQSVRLVHN